MSRFTDCMKFIALAMVFLLKLNGFGWLAPISKAFVFLKLLFSNLTFSALCSLLPPRLDRSSFSYCISVL